MKKILYPVFAFSFLSSFASYPPSTPPSEGMWIPLLLEALNEKDMRAMGLKLSAEDIYSVNHSSLKDAIAQFGGGCTSSFISGEGLLLTNHHCGYSQIQGHSTVDHDYLTDGFWAADKSGELKCNGLTVTLIVRIEDVTETVLKDIPAEISELDREKKIQEKFLELKKTALEGTQYEAFIRPFFQGNEYYMIVTETFNDVRMVGAPPSSIGKFGGDTDNWMWPRHTGDFSLFRVYANQENKPAEYSVENVPYQPKHFLPVSIRGVEKGDFTMVYGFPGRTSEYLTSFAVEHTYSVSNPVKIALREKRLEIMDSYMKQNDTVRIQYAAKYAGISNYHKKWIGENRGLKKLRAIEAKMKYESEILSWIQSDAQFAGDYGNIFDEFKRLYAGTKSQSIFADYLNEAAFGIEAFAFAYRWRDLVALCKADDPDETKITSAVEFLRGATEGFFKNYHAPLDREVTPIVLEMMMNGIDKSSYPPLFQEINKKYSGNCNAYADELFRESFFVNRGKTEKVLTKFSAGKVKIIEKDPVYQLMEGIFGYWRESISPGFTEKTMQIEALKRKYMALIRRYNIEGKNYPDANSTLRVAYGKVDDYIPADGVYYNCYTTLDGIMEKFDPSNEEFVLPEKLIELYKAKDYGAYGQNGTMRVCFIASNHTTGGNSGSPVIDGEGNLIGLNFDRNWEGTMSDIMYDPDRCRNISMDTRYLLFVIDKFAGAGHLVNEMKLVTK